MSLCVHVLTGLMWGSACVVPDECGPVLSDPKFALQPEHHVPCLPLTTFPLQVLQIR